jgi:peptidoglycan/LPS O-acetylase OafA/YrhL
MTASIPKTVLSAVVLLAVTLLVGLVQILRFLPGDLPVSPVITYGITITLYLFFGALLYLIARGKDWARFTYTAILILGFLKATVTIVALLQSSEVNPVLPMTLYGAKVIALILLYVPPSNAWFRRAGQL